jgi:hypothetical protein
VGTSRRTTKMKTRCQENSEIAGENVGSWGLEIWRESFAEVC